MQLKLKIENQKMKQTNINKVQNVTMKIKNKKCRN